MKPTVLVICENFTTAIRIVPAYLKLRENGRVRPVFFTTFGEPEPLKLFADKGVDHLTVRDVIDDGDRERLAGLREGYEAVFRDAAGRAGDTTCRYRGVPLLPWIGEEMLRLNQTKIFCNYVFRRLAERFDPSLVFTAYCSGGKKKQYVTMADRMGIPTLHLQYGANLLPKGSVRRELFSSHYCVWGEAFRELYVDDPEKRGRTLVTGDPCFDEYGAVDAADVRGRLGLCGDDRLVMVGVCFPHEGRALAEGLAAGGISPREVFVVKLHPSLFAREAEIAALFREFGGRCRVVANEFSAYELLAAADHYVAMEQESLWLSAFHFGLVPVVVDGFGRLPRERHPLPWVFDACGRIGSLRELGRLDDAVAPVGRETVEAAGKRLWHRNDFQASERVAAVAENLAFGVPVEEIRGKFDVE